MKTKVILSCCLAALIPGFILATPNAEKGPRGIDAKGDSAITRTEAKGAATGRLMRNAAASDAETRGEQRREERRSEIRERRQERLSRIQAADTDGNGALSLSEAKAANMPWLVRNFDAIDANDDGQVTPDEIRAFRQKRMEQRAQTREQRTGRGQAEAPDDQSRRQGNR